MKIKIVEPGNESFTGHLGNIQFIGGVSTTGVSEAAIAGIAAIYRIERLDPEAVAEEVQAEDLTPEGQEDGETTPEGQEVTSEEQNDGEEAAEVDGEAQEQAPEGDAAKE